MKKLVVLISGNGSNLQAIIDACQAKELNAKICTVISDKPQAFGLERARKAAIPTISKEKKLEQSRESYDSELAKIIDSFQPDWIILAGWMRLLSQSFLRHFPHKVINLHPALPGMFPGINSIARAFAAYQTGNIKETGVMVHLVPDEGIDSGPILAQKSVPIYASDTIETLSERIHHTEHKLLIETLKNLT